MIAGVAVKDRTGKIWYLPKPCRHPHVFWFVTLVVGSRKGMMDLMATHEQGFVTEDGIYLNRKEAWDYAFRHKQLLGDRVNRIGELFSEFVW